ncbi:MAG TPA: cysteate synthase [Bacteroidales bacterium]|nr:cysteate synthase [Bacteroidales bacterium]
MVERFAPTEYALQSLATGALFPDAGWTLDAPGEQQPALVRAVYAKTQLELKDESWGIFRYADWLPVQRMLQGSGFPVTYRSEALAAELGLESLWITFSGWWPERGARMKSGSFKETEAYAVCGRLSAEENRVLVVASAGNTARAFARVCSENGIPLLLSVPEDNLDALWFDQPIRPCVKLIASRKGGDYYDAIHLSNLACQLPGYFAEGGAKNVARRDGMGTTVLSAATTIGRIPDYYYQAIGSGTGAIAAWEANLRLLADGRFGSKKMILRVSQNWPFIPIHDAWKARSRQMLPMDDDEARRKVEIIRAKVLSNRKPPYPILGGLYDALEDTGGNVLYANNEEAMRAAELFERLEGIDIHPAAAVATATLIADARDGKLPAGASVMLNVTGGGEERFQQEHHLHFLKPSLIFDLDPTLEDVGRQLQGLSFKL